MVRHSLIMLIKLGKKRRKYDHMIVWPLATMKGRLIDIASYMNFDHVKVLGHLLFSLSQAWVEMKSG